MPRLLVLVLLAGCFPALERPPALVDGDGDGYVGAEDCDDGNEAISPDADELCNDGDDDCDGRVDEDLPAVWYEDADGDGIGATTAPYQGCDPPTGWVETTGDCNDADGSITAAELWYPDLDEDGYGDSRSGVSTCEPPAGWLRDGTDCDDSSAEVSPEGTEVCDPNDIDEDCDGFADNADPEGAQGAVEWRADGDGDGYGAGAATLACDPPAPGDASGPEDCDDSDPLLHPDTAWYTDGDGDGYGTTATGDVGCTDPGGAAPLPGDCADADASRHPGAAEICEATGVDEDCDGFANEADPEGASGELTYYVDGDEDGYGEELSATVQCSSPGSGWITTGGDCDDVDPAVNPDAAEVCDDAGVDEDCDGDANADDPDGASGSLALYPDADGDSWGADGSSPTTSCDPIAGMASRDGDCDDSDPAVHPETAWCPDGDGDGWGDNFATPSVGCTSPGSTYVPNCADCDDATASTDPDAQWYVDTDYDNFGTDDTLVEQCTEPSPPFIGQWVGLGGDCDDGDANTFPGAPETCQDGVLNSCDGTGDDLCLPSGIVALDDLSTVIYGQGLRHFAGAAVAGFEVSGADELAIGSPGSPRTHHRAIPMGETTLRALGGGYTGEVNLGYAMAPMGSSVLVGEPGSSRAYVLAADVAIPRDAANNATATLVGPAQSGAGTGVVTGDFDGDGDLDAIVCAPNGALAVSQDGGDLLVYARIWTVPGPLAGTIDLTGTAARGYTLPANGAACEHMVATPDVTRDGAQDLVVGMPAHQRVYVFSGAKLAAGLALPQAYTIDANDASFGTGVAVGEGLSTATLAVGAPEAGAVSLIDMETQQGLARITGPAGFGLRVALPGDLDGDGEPDLVATSGTEGRAYLVDGAAVVSGDQGVSGRTLAIFEVGTAMGVLAYAGHDVNDDGTEDLVIAAPNYGEDRGRLWVLYGAR